MHCLTLRVSIALLCASFTGGCAVPRPDTGGNGDYTLGASAAEIYERFLVPPLFAPWADDLIDRAMVGPGDRVLDVACGTGIVARRAAARTGAGAVTGLDISRGMLAVARTTETDGPDITWVEGDALRLPFPDRSFEVVFCQQGLQFFPDRRQAIAEMYRVLVPGGRVAISVWRGVEDNPYGEAVATAVARRVGNAAAGEVRSPFSAAVGDGLADLLTGAGFTEVRAETVTLPMREPDLPALVEADVMAYPATGAAIAAWPASRRRALVAEIVEAMAEYEGEGAWAVPFRSMVATARKPR